MTEAPGRAARTPDSLLRDPMSTALTLAGPASARPAGIVEILRFLSGVQRRYAFNVSTMDTHTPPDLFPSARPRPQGHQPAQGSRPSGCLRSEETAHLTKDSRMPAIRDADEEAVRADQEVRTAPRVSIPGVSTLQPWFSRANRVWSARVDRTSTVGPAPEMTAG